MAIKEKVSIEKINIKIGKEVLDLSLDQAKELRLLLNELFEQAEPATIYIPSAPVIIPQPYPVYPYRRYDYWEITCGAGNGTITYCLSET